MIKWAHRIIWFAETVLYVVSLIVLVYLSENNHWLSFFIVAGICAALYVALKLVETHPIRRRLKDLEQRKYALLERFDAYGISALFNMADNTDVHERNLRNAQIIKNGTSFALLAETGRSYLDPSARRHWDELKRKLQAGSQLRLLIINPFCEAKATRNLLNGVGEGLDRKLDLDRVLELHQQYWNIDVRFTNEVYCSLFFSEREMIYDPYHLGKVTNRLENYFIALHMTPGRRQDREFSYYEMLKSHFDFLWSNQSISFDEFLKKYRARLAGTKLQDLKRIERRTRASDA
jgi:hypothetical protein